MKKLLLSIILLFTANAFSASFTVTYGLNGVITVKNTMPTWSYTSWEIEYGPVGFVTGAGTSITGITTITKALDINPFLDYDIRVRSRYGNIIDNWEYFTTYPQTTMSGEYTTDFESNPIEEGWRGYCTSSWGTITYQTIGGYGGGTSNKYVETNTVTNGTNCFWVAPKAIDLTNHKSISFYLKNFTTNSPGTVTVGTLSNPYDPSTFHPLQVLNPMDTNGNWKQFSLTTAAYNGTDQYIAIKSVSTSLSLRIGIDRFVYKEICEPVTNITISDLTENSARVNFTTQYPNTWRINLYTNSGFGQNQTVETTSNSYNFENLIGTYTYTVQITSLCSVANTSQPTSPVSFTTPCGTMVPGYHNGFEDLSHRTCWNLYPADNAVSYSNTSPNSVVPANSGNFCQSISYSPISTDYKYSISRYAELNNQQRIRFYMTAGEINAPVEVGTMANPADPSTFVLLKLIQPSEIRRYINDHTYSYWKMHIVYLDNYNIDLQHHYIAIRFKNSALGYAAVYLDDLYFENSPSCKEPLNPRSSLITHNSATIAWDNPQGSSATSWEAEYGLSGFTPGTGTGIIFTASSNPFTITNVALDNTLYDFYVRINCGNGYSPYSERGQFKTKCSGITTGTVDGFEQIAIESTLNSCWSRLTTSDANTQPGDHIRVTNTKAHNGTKSMMMVSTYLAPGSFEKTLLISPRLIGLDSYKIVKFWMFCTSNAQTTAIKIGSMSDPGNYQTFTEYQTITVPDNQEGSWIQYTVNMANYNLTNEYLAFRHADSNSATIFYIDDFEYTGLLCPLATNLVVEPVSASTLKVSWNGNTGVTPQATEVEMWTSTQGSTTFTTTENPFIIDATAGVNYTFRVRNICQPGLTGEWSAYRGWILGCEKFAPYFENFDGLDEEDGLPTSGCWALIDPSGTNDLVNTPEDGLSSEPRYMSMTDPDYNTTALTYLVSPALLDMDINKVLRFFAKTENFDTPGTGLLVGTLTLPYDLTTFVPYATINTADAVNGKEVEVDFSGYTGTAKHIAIIHPDIEPTYSYIDDILYYDKSTCPPPFNASVIENSDTTATIGWQAQQSVQSYRIEYGPHGFTPGTGTVINATGTEKKITGLQSGLEYDYYIKSQCGSGYSAVVVGPRSFHTACASKSIPWIEKFTGMSQYGTNILPECFRLYNGNIKSFNQSYQMLYSSVIIGGTDDSFFLQNNDFNSTLILPTFNFVAGTTYTFSVKAHKLSYSTSGLHCKTGRSNMYYNLNISLPDAELTFSTNDYTYKELKYVFTPIVSGVYSIRADLYGFDLIMDDFKLTEGYTSVINSNNQLFDFSDTLPSSLLIEGTTLANPTVNGAVYMPGATLDETWASVNNMGRSALINTPSDIWEANENFITKLNTKIDASAMQQLYMSFDLSQSFTNVNSESLFRVVVNGEVLGNVIMPQSPEGDGAQTFQYDLTPYVGGDIKISLQHLGRHANDGVSLGDTAYLDNLRFTDHPALTRPSTSDVSKIVVYPNPVKGLLTIQNVPEGSLIEVYSLSGQLLASEKSILSTSKINLMAYNSDVYMVRVSTGSSRETFKVVKQ